MKQTLLLLMAMIAYLTAHAQDIQSVSSRYDGGDITFKYYDKDGARIPHGNMKFTKEYPPSVSYMEQGKMKDGLRDGEWTIDVSSGKLRQHIVENYLNGLLDGEKRISCTEVNPSTGKVEKSYPDVVYNFKNGRLYGENTIVWPEITRYVPQASPISTTFVVNYNAAGTPTGVWTVSEEGRDTIEFELSEDGTIMKMYEIGIMGKIEKQPDLMKLFSPIAHSRMYFTEVPFAVDTRMMQRIKRPILPSLFMTNYHEEYKEIMDIIPKQESPYSY